MAAQRNPQPEEEDLAPQAVDGQGQSTSPGALAERHRTSKGRAPKDPGKQPESKGKPRRERPRQEKLPFTKVSRPVGWMATRFSSSRNFRFIMWGSAILLVVSILGFLYFYIAGSKFFALRDIDLEGNVRLTKDEVKAIVGPMAEKGLLRIDLDKVREEIKKNELVKEVEVTRLLPDVLYVKVQERALYARAVRSDGTLICVDKEGVMIEGKDLTRYLPDMPLIRGLDEGRGQRQEEINRARLMTYQKLLEELDGSQPALSSRIDEVYFDPAQGVRVVLKDSSIGVYLGNEDFRMRLNAALDVLDAVRRGDAEALNVLRIGDAERLLGGAKISYLNATMPKRVVVGLDE